MFEDTTNRNNTSPSTADVRATGGGSGRAGPVRGRCAPHGSTGHIRQDSAVGDLVKAARQGDQAAWEELVRRYVPLVLAVTRTYRLRDMDAEDVSQFIWLQLVEQLDRIREPLALPKWIITTARRESRRLATSLHHTVLMDPLVDTRHHLQPEQAEMAAGLLRAEEHQALRDGLAELPAAQRTLLLLLTTDPPLSYRQISRMLDIPVGSIGPMRARCLQTLRATSALRPFLVSRQPLPSQPPRARGTERPGRPAGPARGGSRPSLP